MAKGILGRKVGMTQVFNDLGHLVPVTVIEVEGNVVTQKKTLETDGYVAVQLGFDTLRDKLSNKPQKGHFGKADTAPKRYVKEFRGEEMANFEVGQEVKADLFAEGEMVDVTGTSKGKGFAGAIKRHNQRRGPMSHGSHYHRGPGSLGQIEPKRVFKGMPGPGHMGTDTVTIQNLEVVKVDVENGLLLVKGNVPGPRKSFVMIKNAVKSK